MRVALKLWCAVVAALAIVGLLAGGIAAMVSGRAILGGILLAAAVVALLPAMALGEWATRP